MSVRYEVDYSDIERLSKSIAKLGGKSEEAINNSLDKRTEKAIVPSISKLIPLSRNRRDPGIRSKIHARNSKWHKKEKGNLEVTIKSKGGAAKNKGSYGYLVFPDEGRGRTNSVEHRFMERGLEAGTPELLEGVQEDLVKMIEEVL